MFSYLPFCQYFILSFFLLPPIFYQLVDFICEHYKGDSDAGDHENQFDDGGAIDSALDLHGSRTLHAAIIVSGEQRIKHSNMDKTAAVILEDIGKR